MSEYTFECDDEMLPAAVDVILETQQASVSMIQRRLKLGYARAARIVDEMEEKGIVGPFAGSKPRAILVTRKQWELMRAGKLDEYSEAEATNDSFDALSDIGSYDSSVSSGRTLPHSTLSVKKTRRKFSLSAFLKGSGKPKPRWAKYLSGFIFLCGAVGIMNSFGDPALSSFDRNFYLVFGLLLCAISTVSVFRWFVFSLLALSTSFFSLPNIYSRENGIDSIELFLFISFFVIALFYLNKIRKRFIAAQIAGFSAKTMEEIDCMSGLEFEEFTAQLLTGLGYTDVVTTKASGDQGIDVLAQKNGLKYAIQCKNYSSKLGNTPVQEAYAGKVFYDCDVAVVITNSTFTPGACELASSVGVLLWDRNILQNMIYEATK